MEERKQLSARIEFGNQLKTYRKVAGISQNRLAKALMKQQPYIVSIEKGETGVGIDKMEQISNCFGVKYYDFANPEFPVPTKNQLRKSLQAYLSLNEIDPSYLDDETTPNYSRNMDAYLASNRLREQKSSYQIARDYEEMFNEPILPSKVTDILTKAPRNRLVSISKPESGRGNLYQLKKS